MPPGSFIPLAEQLGLIAELGECVLRRAVSELLRLRAELNDDNPGLFVNVSPAQLLEPGFADLVRDVIDSYGLPPKCLRLEVTENMLIDESPAVLQTIDELRAAGACIVLDDFGSGYASLATLMRVPFDGVKLDRSIVSRLGIDDEAPHQIRAIIELIHSLRVAPVIAEGVETEEQARILTELGCDWQISTKGEPLQTGDRWVVERTNAWHTRGFKKLLICTERRACVNDAFIALANSVIIIRRLIRQA